MQPYDYSIRSNPLGAIQQGLGMAQGFKGLRQQDLANEQQQFAFQQQQQAVEAEKRRALSAAALSGEIDRAVDALGDNPSPSDLAALTLKYPQITKQAKQAFDMLGESQKQARLNQASQIYAALESGNNDAAVSEIVRQRDAYKNAGDSGQVGFLDLLLEQVKSDPAAARFSAGMFLSSAMGTGKFTDTFSSLQQERREKGLFGAELSEAQSKAQKAATVAKFAESNAALDLKKKGWDISKIQNDMQVSRQNSQIAAMTLALSKQKDAKKQQELQQKIDEKKLKRDELVQKKVFEYESAVGNIDNMLNTADRIANTPLDVVENATGPVDRWTPTVRQSTADFEALIENFDAQAFMSQIPQMKGAGALSDAEGKKLAAALQNFSLKQSPGRLLGNVKEAQRLLIKARSNLANKYGIPKVSQKLPDTPEVQTTATDLDSILRKYGVIK
jgi:hypothetical protein